MPSSLKFKIQTALFEPLFVLQLSHQLHKSIRINKNILKCFLPEKSTFSLEEFDLVIKNYLTDYLGENAQALESY
jgi:hypothetical protein